MPGRFIQSCAALRHSATACGIPRPGGHSLDVRLDLITSFLRFETDGLAPQPASRGDRQVTAVEQVAQ
jgi:hypothetical protein